MLLAAPIWRGIFFTIWCGLFFGPCSTQLRAADAVPLRLVATVDGHAYDQFSVTQGTIMLSDGRAVPDQAKWSMQGNLLENVGFARFSPWYWVVQHPPPEGSNTPRAFASVYFRGPDWTLAEQKKVIAVCVWIVDGRPEIVAPTTMYAVRNGYSAHVFFELNEKTRRGAPLLLLLGPSGFVPARPLFDDVSLQRVLELMHVGSHAELVEAIEHLPSTNKTTNGDFSLLHVAAESGLTDAVG